ncbi:MAG: hypothetical protein JW726_18830 [Anaerolineales bacterium]|nr:hypothetical protein [Anaerolineales bacterium]
MRALIISFCLVLLVSLLPACNLPSQPTEHPLDDGQPSAPLSIATPAPPLPEPLCAQEQTAFITDLQIHQPPDLPEPQPRQPFLDPVFGSCLVRVTDRGRDLSPEDDSSGLKNEYSRVQSFNADESLLLVRSTEAYWYLYDARSLQPLATLPLTSEPRWDASDPNRIYYTEETSLFSFDIISGQSSLVRNFAADLPGHHPLAVWTRYEGSPSSDTRYWGFMAENEDWIPTAFLVYDRLSDSVTVRDLRGVAEALDDVDHVTISPLGTYFLASFDRACEHGQLGSDAHPCGLMVYSQDLRTSRSLLRIIGHYDTALDSQGREVLIYQDIDTDTISLLDLESGAVTQLFAIDFSHTPIGLHFSGCAFNLPGWALVSTHSGGYPQSFTWMDNQVFAVELAPSGRVVRLAHTHSIVDENQEHDYWAEPQATVNRDFTRILFTSNWGLSGTAEVEMYLIALPADWIASLP